MFCPQRYLNDDSLPDPFQVIFGFGRRLDQLFYFYFWDPHLLYAWGNQGFVRAVILLRLATGG